MLVPAASYGAEHVVTTLNQYGCGHQEVISNKKLLDWAKSVDYSTNSIVASNNEHSKEIDKLREKVDRMEAWTQGAATFLDFVASRYPDIVNEFNLVEKAKMLVGNTPVVMQIVDKER